MNDLQYEFLDIRSLSDEQYEHAFALMSPQRQQRALNIRRKEDRQRLIAADSLARRMTAQRFDIVPEAVTITNLESGQPVLSGLPCHISLSHSGNWVMCALCSRPVGADIEVISQRGQHVFKRVCTPEEQSYILASGQFDSLRFTRIWTAKEALLKHSGKGLSGGIGNTVVADSNGLFSRINGCLLICGQQEDAIYSVIC